MAAVMTLLRIGVCGNLGCSERGACTQLWWWGKDLLCRVCWRARLGVRDKDVESAA